MTVPVPVVVADDVRTAPGVEVDLDRWRRLAEAVLADEGVDGELTLTFVDDDEMAALNEEHMGKAGPTDVLSFPMDDPDEELALLVVHGILHVLGHDHAEPDETAVMRERELQHLVRHHWMSSVPSGFRQNHDD